MNDIIPINLVVEDELSEVVVRKILSESRNKFEVGVPYSRGDYGYIKQRIDGFNKAAKGTPYAVIVDLEDECPPSQIMNWLQHPIAPNLVFRIAVREIESWILADRKGFAALLNVSVNLIPPDTDRIQDPKQFLIDLTRKSRRHSIREAIVPRHGSTAKVGPYYNGQLSQFVLNEWSIEEAINYSESLKRAVHAFNRFKPVWDDK